MYGYIRANATAQPRAIVNIPGSAFFDVSLRHTSFMAVCMPKAIIATKGMARQSIRKARLSAVATFFLTL